jgi:L-ascorbate metabolism protein UlaG (beta-lactamase superfamily)
MVITYMGGQCFKITQGDLTLAFNPPSKDSDFKTVKFGSDIALVSQNHPDFNGTENTVYGEREPFVISGPGEYEVRGIAVRGFGSTSKYGAKGETTHLNTIYSVLLDGMNLCFLGAQSDPALPKAAQQELDDIDVLFVPVGGEGVLDAAEAYKLAVSLEPKAVVPMHYSNESLKSFLKEAGAEGTKPIEKLTVKKKDLDGKESEIIVLAS